MSYTPGTGGRVQVAVPDGSTVSVTITALSGKSIVVYSDAARTASVSMPNSATVPTAYYVRSDDVYQVSCLVGGVECAVQGSTTGVATVDLRGDQTCSIGVDSEFAQNSGGGGSDLPTPTTGDAGKVVTVNDGEDGYELDVPGGASEQTVTFPDLPGWSSGLTVTGQVLTVTGTGYLADTPSVVFSGADEDIGNVQAQGTIDGEGNFTDGLVVVDYGAQGALSFIVTNGTAVAARMLPALTTGDAGKVVTVNGDEDGYELDTPSAGYASLTGAGEGASPGDLTQNGALTVSGAFEADIPDDGTAYISAVGEGTVQLATQDGTLNIASTATGTVQITTQDGDLDLRTFGAGEISLQAEAENSSIAIVANQPGSAVWITGAAISFFGVAPTARPDAPTTLEEVIAALQALGLVGT